MDMYDLALKCLAGAYDLHVHSAPSHRPRSVTDIELLREADRYGMAGVLIKNHYESTAGRVATLNSISGTAARAYSGVALNYPLGGINPYAVESALGLGADIVWMPTCDSANCCGGVALKKTALKRPGLTVFDESGRLIPEVYSIFDIVKSFGAVLATGHLSAQESLVLCSEGRKQGVRMVLTHPESWSSRVPFEAQLELAKMGVYIEKCWYNIADGAVSIEEVAGHIGRLGVERVFLTTDRGQRGKGLPPEEMLLYIKSLLSCGIREESIIIMTHSNPHLLLEKLPT